MPIPPQISLKVIVLSHFVLTVWASMVPGFLPPAYIYMNGFILAFGFWAIVNQESIDAIFMFLVVNLISILMDVIFLGIYVPQGRGLYEPVANNPLHARVNEYRFCLGMSIVNLIIKPFTSFVLYRLYQERGGQYGDFGIPGLPHFGQAGRPSADRGYEDIDRQVESAEPHDFQGPTGNP